MKMCGPLSPALYSQATVLPRGLRSPIDRASQASASSFVGQALFKLVVSNASQRYPHKKAVTRSRMIPGCNDDCYLTPGSHPAAHEEIKVAS